MQFGRGCPLKLSAAGKRFVTSAAHVTSIAVSFPIKTPSPVDLTYRQPGSLMFNVVWE